MASMQALTCRVAAAVAVAISASCEFPIADPAAALSDQEFWRLTVDLSEPGGVFQSENLTSNEGLGLVADAAERTTRSHVYLGVGPEQNFSYIAATRPSMAFVIDIRRGNLQLQLMYKALFELAADRADFLSRLFTRSRPGGLDAAASAAALMTAYHDVPRGTESMYAANLSAIEEHLTKTRRFPMGADDLAGVAAIYRAFFWYGPEINYAARVDLSPVPERIGSTFRDLMVSIDRTGLEPSFLGSAAKFAVVKSLQERNLIVPIVGNFSGSHSLRAIADYINGRGGIVGMFYVSNVETYLQRDNTWPVFCKNLRALPSDAASLLIRTSGPSTLPGGIGVTPLAATMRQCS